MRIVSNSILSVSCAVLASFALNAYAQQNPYVIPYQGVLERDGVAIDGTVDLELTLYPTSDGGSPLWGPNEETVEVVDGRFQTLLGAGGGIDPSAFATSEQWLQIRVSTDDGSSWDSFSERHRVFGSSASYDGGIPPGTIMAWAGSVAQIPAGWLLCDGANASSTTYYRLRQAIGESWGDGDDGPGGLEFSLPDIGSRFLRGAESGKHIVGTLHEASTAMPRPAFAMTAAGGHYHGMPSAGSHSHTYTDATVSSVVEPAGRLGWYDDGPASAISATADEGAAGTTSAEGSGQTHVINAEPGHTHALSGTLGDSVTRPDSVSLNWIIKY